MVDPAMEAMAAKMAAGRAARPQAMPREVEQEPPEVSGLAEVRSKLEEAMALLDNLGGAEDEVA